MGRIVMNAPKGTVVDHLNRNGLDNRKANLRLATANQNQWNRGANRTNITGLKGVHKLKHGGKFQSNIRFNGKKIYLGLYDTAEMAHAAYREKANELHGAFARYD